MLIARRTGGLGFFDVSAWAALTPAQRAAQWATVLGQRYTITPRWDWEHGKGAPWTWSNPANRPPCPAWPADVREAYVERELLLMGQGVLPDEPGFGYRADPMPNELQRFPGTLVLGARGAADPYWCPTRSSAKWLLNLYVDRKHLYDSLNCAWDSPLRCANQAACYVGKVAYFVPKGIDAVVNTYLARLSGGLIHLNLLTLISKLNGLQRQQMELYLLSQLGWDCSPSWHKTVTPVQAALPVLGYADLNDVVGDLAAWGVLTLKAGTQLQLLGPRSALPPAPITQALADVEPLADLHKELFTLVSAGTGSLKTPAPVAPVAVTAAGLLTPKPPGYPPGTIATPDKAGGYRVAIPRSG